MSKLKFQINVKVQRTTFEKIFDILDLAFLWRLKFVIGHWFVDDAH